MRLLNRLDYSWSGRKSAQMFVRLVFVCLVVFSFLTETVRADTYALGKNLCVLTDDGSLSAKEALAQLDRFSCEQQRFSTPAKQYWIHGDVSSLITSFEDPVLRMRVARHGPADLVLIFEDGHTETTHYSLQDMKDNWRSPSHTAMSMRGMSEAMPVQFLLSVERPWDPWNLSDLTLLDSSEDIASHEASYLFNAVSCALLIAPFLIGLIFLVTLRQRFLLFYLITSASIIITQLLWGGIAFDILPLLTLSMRSILAHISIAVLVSAAVLLVRDMCGPEKLGSLAYVWTKRVAILPPLVTLPLMFVAPKFPVAGSLLFHLAIFIPIPVLVCAMIVGARNGSRTAMGLLLGTSGFVVIALTRILKATDLVPGLPTFDHGFYYATMLDAAVMCGLVCVRAMKVRFERDKALLENSLLFEYATTDPLTGLLNRRGLNEAYKTRIFEPKQDRDGWAMLLLDLDHFKTVNDQYGHDVGDLYLAQFAAILQQCCQPGDLCARIGGEEFVVLTVSSGREGAKETATRIRSVVAGHQFGDAQTPRGRITTSIGVAMIPHLVPIAFDTIYRLADQALYTAKSHGRNCVMLSELSATFSKRSPVGVKSDEAEEQPVRANKGGYKSS